MTSRADQKPHTQPLLDLRPPACYLPSLKGQSFLLEPGLQYIHAPGQPWTAVEKGTQLRSWEWREVLETPAYYPIGNGKQEWLLFEVKLSKKRAHGSKLGEGGVRGSVVPSMHCPSQHPCQELTRDPASYSGLDRHSLVFTIPSPPHTNLKKW